METKIIKNLKFGENATEQYQIDAAKLGGHTYEELASGINFDLNITNGSGTGALQQTNVQSMEENIPSDSIQPVANANGATALGYATKASGQASFATGIGTTASGDGAHAEGNSTNASVLCAHAEGARTTASGAASHAEGADTVASGNRAHAEGSYTTASGSYSHAEGFHTKAESGYMHAQGKYNKTTSGYAHVVGWGEDENNRKDIHRLSTSGGAWFAGKLYSGNNEIATNLSNGYKVIDGNKTEIPGALRQCNLTLSIDSVKEYIIGKAYVKDECCWYNAGTEEVPVWELYRCTTSYGEAKTDAFIDLKDTYWEFIDTSVEGFNFNNLQIPAQGYNPKAEGIGSFAVGYNTKAYKSYSFASGNGSVANKSGAHAEGYQTYADANASHTEGTFTKTHGDNSHAEGTNTVTTGHDAHAEGTDTGAAGLSSHTEGYQTIAGQFIEVITENLTIVNEDSIPTSTFAKGTCVKYVLANGSGYRVYYCPANNIVFSEDSWVRAWFVRDSIIDNITYQLYALAVSDKSQFGEHAEGYQTIAQGQSAHAEGTSTKALADFAHAEGQLTSATGVNAHAEGRSSSATKDAAHAEGVSTTASALAAHAEGQNTVAEGQASHAEGARSKTSATAAAAHAEGADTLASGNRSHAEGEHTVASEAYQHVQGRYNIVDSNNKAGNYAHIVGNGTSAKRSNAHTLDWDGNAWFAGDVTVGVNNKKLATQDAVNSKVGKDQVAGTDLGLVKSGNDVTISNGIITVKHATKAKGIATTALDMTDGKTIANLQTQLKNWIANHTQSPGACCTFFGTLSDVMAKWGNAANTFGGGGTNTVHLETVYGAYDYALLRFTSYYDKEVYYAALIGGTWGSMHKVVFNDDAAASQLGLVKSGGDATISNGIITVDKTTNKSLTGSKGLLVTAVEQPANSVVNYQLSGESYTADDLPPAINGAAYKYSAATVIKRYSDNIHVILHGMYASTIWLPTQYNTYDGSKWHGWVTTIDSTNINDQIVRAIAGKLTGSIPEDNVISRSSTGNITIGNSSMDDTNYNIMYGKYLAPYADTKIDLGTSSRRFKDGYFSGTVTANKFEGTATKVQNTLKVGSKTYDGSSSVEILPSDLGLSGAMKFLGYTTTAITDESTTNPITIDGKSVTATAGNVVLYSGMEFVWTGAKWEQYGNEGSMSIKGHTHPVTITPVGTISKASTTPKGTVSTPTITVTPNTTTVNSITGVGSLPSLTYSAGKASNITKWDDGSIPSLTYSAVEASKITGWSAGSVPSLTFSQGTLPSASFTQGTLPALTKSVANRCLTLTFTAGTLPTHSFSAGTLPSATFSAGSVPSLTYSKVDADNITGWSAGAAPVLEYSQVDIDDITAWSAGSLPTKGSNTTVVTGIKSATSTQPAFTGTPEEHTHTFTGTAATITTSGSNA